MKHIIFICLSLMLALTATATQDSISNKQTSSSRASDIAYNEANFEQAIQLLEKEKQEQLTKGLESAHLYYNLGNAYFRVNDLGKARLYYEKALLIDPSDKDTRHNIEYLSSKIEDKILVADNFFLSKWLLSLQNKLSSDQWSQWGIGSFVLLILCLCVFFFSSKVVFKKTAFYAGIVLVVVLILSNSFAFGQKEKIMNRNTAVVITGSATVVSAPDINSKEIFLLHAGTKVRITKQDRNWVEIEIDNGSVGWMQRNKIEII